jgi:putative heme-binding domain-containing protein
MIRELSAWLLLPAIWLAISIGALAAADESPTPHWIKTEPADQAQVRRDFEIGSAIQSARLKIAADFCEIAVEINERLATTIEPYSQTVELDVTRFTKLGQNQITIRATRAQVPAAVALELDIATSAGRQSVVTDESWRLAGSGAQVRSLGSVAPELWGLGRRSPAIDAFDNYEQWRQAVGGSPASDPANFWIAPGFEISLVRSAQPDEGSWVSMAFDREGRLTIAREDQGLLRMTLDEPRKSITKVETIDRTLLECRGLLYAYGSLYANANNSKGLYRLTDVDGDGQFDKTELLREFPGGVGHGRNDLALGPDGLIYSIHGDSVDVPARDVLDHTSPLRRQAERRQAERRQAERRQAEQEPSRGPKTSEGHLLRMDPGDKNCELLCGGLRNPFGVAFNAAGDAFTYDADAEFDMGTPWYRPTRVVQLASGADFAWRGVTGQWPPYFPDHAGRAPATLDIGRGSPTAVAFGTGSSFPPPYRDALFILDWAYGRVLAVHLAPRGAGYRAAAETFLKGRPLNVTDLAFGPDGAMYLITGGRKTQSALYQVSYRGQPAQVSALSTHEEACARHAAESRSLRQRLEAFHGRVDPAAIGAAWPHLSSPDPRIRYAARIAIEHQPISTWRDKALGEAGSLAFLALLPSLASIADETTAPQIFDGLLKLDAASLTKSQALAVLGAYQALRLVAPAIVSKRQSQIATQLESLARVHSLEGAEPPTIRLRHELARLLVDLGAPAGRTQALTLLASEVQEDRLMGLFVLRHVKEGWSQGERRAYFSVLNDAGRFVAGEGMPRFVASLREQSLATLSDAERTALADVIEPRHLPEPELPAVARPVVKAWRLADLLPAISDSARRGDAPRGATVFRDALCVRCHRIGAHGPAVGPDLTHVSARFSRRDLLASILTPSAVVAENYRNVQVLLKDGRSLVGRTLSEGDFRSETLRLATNPLAPAEIVEIGKRGIQRTKLSESSPMPDHLLDTFDEQAVLDLLAFLEAGAPVNVNSQ